MKNQIAIISLVGALTFGAPNAANAQNLVSPMPLPVAPVTVSAPVAKTQPMSFKVMQTMLLTSYRQVRAFWLSRAIVR